MNRMILDGLSVACSDDDVVRAAGTLPLPSVVRFGEICGLGIVDVCRNCSFAAGRIRIFVGHMWPLFVLLLSARGTRRRRNPGTKKRVVSDALIAKML